MPAPRKVWYYTWVITAFCLLITVWIYHLTGQIVIMILIAPAIIHWIMKKRIEMNQER